jgi:hypothetical protein
MDLLRFATRLIAVALLIGPAIGILAYAAT